ncbi:PHB depolymerase family esterase [Variovorax sp. J22G21]|uniref:extracellular catalytic domain type 1 short-chain-length polyhydroxyalkanoate depolymerase n=1 Tax=Variovorax fucosicus TaxID=3053517 RepID=UPI002578E92E|nr:MULTISPECIES: PHB depolymerase family esterase [unclassified Variovorax]MDM0038008.1 PHB depolymerase family esterase [Variovorax sp. J22R193]MDM0056320.1 PHB depolymerase family esterase [Variovorax sp. J22G47]MDM0062784.1 PHB depolymerase family esterase [Variovorax sp. J22G21]
MARRSPTSALTRAYQRSLKALTKAALGNSRRVAKQVTQKVRRAAAQQRKPPPGAGDWISGMALGPGGARGYHLYRPPGLELKRGEKLPMLVMLHGCGQTGRDFAASTRMNRIAARERFLVLYPEQDRVHHPQGCWNWYQTRSGKADREAATLIAAVDQVNLLYPVDRERIAVAGLSAGAGMAALLASRYPNRFRAVAVHSGVAPGAAQSTASALGAMHGHRVPVMPATAVGKALGAAAVGTTLPPMLVLHGDADTVVAASNAANTAVVWAAATGARPGPERVLQRGKRHPMRVTDFKRAGRIYVTLCQVARLGHAWSGGAASLPFSDAAGPDASKLVWAFVARQFRQPAAA